MEDATGGIKLDQAATFMADVSDTAGMLYDPDSKRIVFVGPRRKTELDADISADDLVMVLRKIILLIGAMNMSFMCVGFQTLWLHMPVYWIY